MVDPSTFVQIRTTIEAGAVPRLAFGRGLLVSVSDRLSAAGTGKVRLFDTLDAATAVFGSTGAVADSARVWFSADPGPQGLYVGRWTVTDVDTTLTGAAVTAPPDSGALDAANASFTLNGDDVDVDLTAADTYANIATAIQTAVIALGGIFTGATFAYVVDRFVLTLAGNDVINGGAFGNTAVTTDTDIAAALGMDSGSDPVFVLGSNAEGVGAGVAAMMAAATSGTPFYVMLAADVPATVASADTRTDLAASAEASDFVYSLLDTADQVLAAGDATSHAALAFAAQQGNVAAVYGQPGDKPDVGLMALMSSQNFDLPASIITAHGKTLPGVAAATIDMGTQIGELARKRTNAYVVVGDTPRLIGGYTSRSGYWLDAVVWLRWLQSAMESQIWGTLTRSRRYTTGLLMDDLTNVLERGVRNGGIEPGGAVSTATRADIRAVTGNPDFDGTLAAGYLPFIPQPTAEDRANRVARFTVWVAGSPAIQEVLGDIRFSN